MEQLPEAPQSRGFISTLFFWFENTNRGRDDYFETVTLHNGSGWKLAFSLAENYKGVNCRSSIWRGCLRKSYYYCIWGWDLAKIELTVHAKTQKGAPLSNFRTRDVVVALRVCRGAFFSRPQPGKCPQQPRKPAATNFTWWYICSAIHYKSTTYTCKSRISTHPSLSMWALEYWSWVIQAVECQT